MHCAVWCVMMRWISDLGFRVWGENRIHLMEFIPVHPRACYPQQTICNVRYRSTSNTPGDSIDTLNFGCQQSVLVASAAARSLCSLPASPVCRVDATTCVIV
ncbi:hypothetical protein CAOG_009510 [Capsaspora owczarzaki ATCC 30864]|uniref:Uncharacterized protein n=1 Tax=Capsaspora owczarzaki (strain ATCC 30864) TaxID=595528 RepID=A0A0D2WKT5_CAPO3|nr:hypothetical protein CAOG_009510 [Capsaspora owczarzaki ATCC 30864]